MEGKTAQFQTRKREERSKKAQSERNKNRSEPEQRDHLRLVGPGRITELKDQKTRGTTRSRERGKHKGGDTNHHLE